MLWRDSNDVITATTASQLYISIVYIITLVSAARWSAKYRPLRYERVYLLLGKVADAPFYI